VKPEIISGGFVNGIRPQNPGPPPGMIPIIRSPSVITSMQLPSSSSQQQQQQQRSRAPTVIMGEVGGVRTMVWSNPQQNQQDQQQQQQQQQIPNNNINYSSEQVKISVDGLLSLGQESSSNSNFSVQQQQQLQQQQQSIIRERPQFQPPLNMERLWAGDLSQLPPQASPLQHPELNPQALNLTSWAPRNQPSIGKASVTQVEDDGDYEPPMVCMICEDKATGLHYGIITCEG
jgi:nuclear receptor subfamily 6 group A